MPSHASLTRTLMKSTALRDKAERIGTMKILSDSQRISAANCPRHGGGIPMDIQERYFVALAATICFVLISIGFFTFN
jgi:hypothetical protein